MILLTGGTGLLGSYVARMLLELNLEFRVLDRGNRPPQMKDIEDQINWVKGDITDTSSLTHALENVQTVIHCAALVSFHKKDLDKLIEVNKVGTANLVNMSLLKDVKNFIHISSTGALSKKRTTGEITENNKWIDDPLNTRYGFTKYLSELEVWRGQEEGLNVAIINPSVILGPGQADRSSAQLFDYVAQEKKFFTDGIINYVDVRDVTDMIIKIMRDEVWGERFISCGGYTSYQEFFAMIGKAMNKKPPNIEVNSRYVQIFAAFESIRSAFTGRRPLITKETAAQTKMNVIYSAEKARKLLGFSFRSLDQTINWCTAEMIKIGASE